MKRLAIFLSLVLASFTLGTVTTIEPAGATMIPASVNSNCGQDVTSQVVNFLSGSGLRELQPNGCYIVNQKISVVGDVDGNNSELRRTYQQNLTKNDGLDPTDLTRCKGASTGHVGFIALAQSGASISNIKLRRLGPSGYNACHYAEHGIEVRGPGTPTDRVSATNVDIDKVWGDCIYIQGTQGATFRDIDCIENGRQGGAIAKGNNILFDGFIVRNSERSGFDFESNSDSESSAIRNFEMKNFDITTDDDFDGRPEGEPPTKIATDSGKIAFPTQGYASPQDNIYVHDGIIRKALSFLYIRQKRPTSGPGGCDGSRQNWRLENITVAQSVSTTPGHGYGFRTADTTKESNKAHAIICGVNNLTFKNIDMPGGNLTIEKVTGNIQVTDNCLASISLLAQSAPVTQARNQIGGDCAAPPTSTTQPPGDTVPDPPTIGTATAQNGQATVRWTAPGDDGGDPITQYQIVSSPPTTTRTVTAPATSFVFPSLTNGTAYRFTVKARNSIGLSAASELSNTVTPTAPTTTAPPTTTTSPTPETPYEELVRRMRELSQSPLPGETFAAFLIRMIRLIDMYV